MHFFQKMWSYGIASQEVQKKYIENLLKLNDIENNYRKIQ